MTSRTFSINISSNIFLAVGSVYISCGDSAKCLQSKHSCRFLSKSQFNKTPASCVYFQFDNFKRVFKVVEELKGPLVENIRQHFLLSDKLAR